MSMPHVVTSLGNVRTHTRRVAEEITQKFRPIYFVWGIGSSGEHAQGRALDFMNYQLGGGVNRPGARRMSFGQRIADYLWRHRARLGVWYIIYNRKIISMTRPSQGWIRYTGSNPHTDHVHVSFYNGVTYRPPESTTPPPLEEDDVSAKDVWDYRLSIDNEKHADLGYTRGDYPAASLLADASHRSRRGIQATRNVADLVRQLAATQTDEVRDAINIAVDQILADCELDDVDENEGLTS